jgi:cytochrome P450
MAAETTGEAGPGIDWLMAQPYEGWGEVRRSGCPVMETHGDVMGPGTFYQITRFKDADAVLRDDKAFASSINTQHIGQFMGELIVGMDGEEHRTYRNLVAKAFRASQLDKWDETLVRPII